MTEFKKKVQSIIEDYCEGINHLEFSIDNFPEMLDRIETEALRIHDVGSLLKAEQEATKEEIREWLRGEDFEGLAERLLDLVVPDKAKEDIVVFDPFGGSFSTMEAVYNMQMQGISCEIDKEYFEKGKKRIERLPPIQAKLDFF